MRELTWFGLAVMLAAVVNQAACAEGGRPSHETLREMGLGGLTIMSDAEAIAIRGHGFRGGNGMNGTHRGSFVAVAGNSFATFDTPFGTSHSENQYAAEGEHKAFGKNHSEAGLAIKIGVGRNGREIENGSGPSGHHGGRKGRIWRPGKNHKLPRNGGHGGMNGGGHGGNGNGHGGMNGNGHGGMNGRPGGGLHVVIKVKLFAGGSSFAAAH
jgi:hypothetical protein